MDRPSAWTLLANRNVRLYLGGQVVSLAGTWMQSVAQGWLVYSLTGSPFWLALTAVALTAPVLFLSLVGGVVADRYDRHHTLVLTQSLAMVPAILLGLFVQSGQITLPLIVLLAAVLGVVNAIDLPVRHVFWTRLVPDNRLVGAVSLHAVVFNGTRIIGPLAAGAIIATWGMAACFYLNAASFAIGIISLLLMDHTADHTRRATANMLGDLVEGLRFVSTQQGTSQLLVLVAVVSLFGIPFVPLLPLFADGVLHVGVQGLGVLAAASGVGALLGAVVLALRGETWVKGRLVVAAGLLFGSCLFVFARSQHFHASLLALVLGGVGVVSLLALVNCLLQHQCPEHLRGRVMGVYTLLLIGMAPCGHALMGVLAGSVGAPGALSVGATVCLAAVLATARQVSRLA